MIRCPRGLVLALNILLTCLALSNLNAQVPVPQYLEASNDVGEDAVNVPIDSARRFDFKWASSIHALVDAIESNDEALFHRTADSLLKEIRVDPVGETIGGESLLEFLRDCFASRSDGLNRLLAARSTQNDFWRDSDFLFALHDILDRLFQDSDQKKRSIQQSIRGELSRRLAKLEDAFGRWTVSESELSRFAFRHIRRLPNDEETVHECERLSQILKDDFGLTSILIERLSSLFQRDRNQWQGKYQHNLIAAKDLLTKDQSLRHKFPIALPKVVIELSRLKPDDASKLLELETALAACDEAKAILAQQKIFSDKTLPEIRASALWDGYNLRKILVKDGLEPHRDGLDDLFAPFLVANALQEVADIHKDDTRKPQRFLGARLRQASVLLDLLTSRSPSAEGQTEQLQVEHRFLEILDIDLKPRLATSSVEYNFLRSETDKTIELELVWIEWGMKDDGSRNQNPKETSEERKSERSRDRKKLLARLNELRNRINSERKDRVLTAIGYINLIYGDYCTLGKDL